ncbi:hypothetical protein DYB30_002695 [Aphanomyces astaci]|uniref:Uncharacterized protein n=1 Tax=Aphanomyces astaci TaxID=112090 RepID=A0A397AHH4_APHAT|nr:hypothetical protein DYB36_000264 [Aphanomyces astaci]RHY60965.1 hypothetical protein DYB30_002695 [Aphanomyces astaci]
MGGESPQKRRLSAAQANVKKPVPEKRGSLPNLLPPLSKRRHDMATKVLPDDPKAAAAPITLPDVATPASAPKGDTLKLPDAPAKATKPAPSASSIKRYKSVLQVSRSKKSGTVVRAIIRESYAKNEGVIDFTGFDLLNRRYPMILFPCFRLQDRIQKATLGEAHWLRIHQRYYDMLKDDLFRKKHGGAAPPVSTSTKLKLIFGVGTFEVYQPV